MRLILKHVLIGLILLITPKMMMAPGHNEQLDSLTHMLEVAGSSEEQIDIYLGLSRLHLMGTGDLEQSLVSAYEAYDIAEQMGSQKYMADALCFVGMAQRALLIEYKQAFERALELAKASKDPNSILFATYLFIQFADHDSEKGIAIMQEVLATYGKSANQKPLGNSKKTIAYEYELIGDFENAERSYLEAIGHFTNVGEAPYVDPKLGRVSTLLFDKGASNLTQVHVYLGTLYIKMGRYQDAIASAKRGATLAEKVDNIPDLAWARTTVAKIHEEFGQYEESIEILNKITFMKRNLVDPMTISIAYQNLGRIYAKMGEFEKAEKRLLLAYGTSTKAPSAGGDILIDLAKMEVDQKKYDAASRHYLMADSLYAQINDNTRRIVSKLGVAETQIAIGLYDNAISAILEILPFTQSNNDYRSEFKSYICLSLAHEKKSDYSTAIQYAKQAHEIALARAQEKNLALQSHATLSVLYENNENCKEGLKHHKQLKALSDSSFTALALQKLKEEQVSQNVSEYIEEKDSAQQLSAALKSQNTLYILLSSLLGLLLIGGSYLVFQIRKSREKIENQNVELNELNATKDRFFGIIAHDIRSPIAALQSVDGQMNHYAKKGDTDKLIQLSGMVGGTAKRLNNLLDNLMNWAMLQTKTIPHHPESIQLSEVVVEAKELFLTNAMDKQIHIRTEVDKELTIMADRNAIQTIIRNLLSNALKFSQQESEVTIQATDDQDHIIITVQDNGVGMTPQQLTSIYQIGKKSEAGTKGEAGTGLGLVLVKELVELNRGEMKIESVRGEGTSIVLKMLKD